MCLLFALWFATGVIMMYVEYPELTEQERLANLPALDAQLIRLSPFQASSSLNSAKLFSAVKLTTVLDRPAFEFRGIDAAVSLVFADTGDVVAGLSEEFAVNAAALSGFAAEDLSPSYDELVDIDQWSISGSLNPYRPLHRVRLNDSEDSVVYVSDRSGQVVLDTSRKERFWNWLGSTIHWIYPVQLRRNASLWNQVIVTVSLIGIVSVISGGIIGFSRVRIQALNRGSGLSPYKGWMKWHHLLGLLSLIFVSTFIFSGLMSMGPWGVFNTTSAAQEQITRYKGADTLRLSNLPTPNFIETVEPIKEVQWHQIQNTPYLSLKMSSADSEIQFHSSSAQNASVNLLALINEAIPALLPSANLESIEVVNEADNYYYSRHNNYRPFPVYRAKFNDSESTWYHIDVGSGEIVNRVTDASRRERWLFNGLHSLDFQFLLRNRPIWDILLILLCLLGFVFSLTAVVIGWRRLLKP